MEPNTRWHRVVRLGLPVLTVAGSVGLIAMLPAVVGMTWAVILNVLAGISLTTLVALAALWFFGLLVHTIVLTAALPGLTHRRALLLNVSGSAVSNLLPFGGAAGVGLGYTMARTWHVPPADFASYTAISNLWNILAKLVVGTVILCVALILGIQLPAALHPGVAFASVGGLLAVVLLLIATVWSSRISRLLGGLLNWGIGPLLARTGRTINLTTALDQLRATSTAAVSQGWARLTFGVLAYLFLQALLLAACMLTVGAHAPWLVLAVAFGIDRLISAFPLTPGGVGLAELGSATALVALGVDPIAAAAGTLLYRLFTFLLEIPVGGACALLWLSRRRRLEHVSELEDQSRRGSAGQHVLDGLVDLVDLAGHGNRPSAPPGMKLEDLRKVLSCPDDRSDHVTGSLAATIGVETVADVAAYLLAGADAVMTTSALLRHGPEHATVLLDGLTEWMTRKDFASGDEVRGRLSVPREVDQTAYERAGYVAALEHARATYGGVAGG